MRDNKKIIKNYSVQIIPNHLKVIGVILILFFLLFSYVSLPEAQWYKDLYFDPKDFRNFDIVYPSKIEKMPEGLQKQAVKTEYATKHSSEYIFWKAIVFYQGTLLTEFGQKLQGMCTETQFANFFLHTFGERYGGIFAYFSPKLPGTQQLIEDNLVALRLEIWTAWEEGYRLDSSGTDFVQRPGYSIIPKPKKFK